MILLTLGLPSSASTWAYNIARSLLAASRPAMLGVFAESAAALREAVPPGIADLVLKTHEIDDALFRIVESSDAPIILTWRDPRDAAVSMAQRTGLPLDNCILVVQRSASCLLSLRSLPRDNTLTLDYGDDYMNRIDTIHAIAELLGVPAPPSLVNELYKSLRTDNLKKSIDAWSKGLGANSSFNTHVDSNTHWHKNHLGDGRSGKWRDLDEGQAATVDAALDGFNAIFAGAPNPRVSIPWAQLAKAARMARPLPDGTSIVSDTTEAPLCLPRGWWTVEYEFEAGAEALDLFEFRIECDGRLLGQRFMSGAEKARTHKVTFEHSQAGSTIYVRCSRMDGKAFGRATLSNAIVSRVSGSLEALETRRARPISTQVLPQQKHN